MGDTLWTKTYGGLNEDRGFSLQQTSDGGFIMTGYTSSFGSGATDGLLVKTDANGNLQWAKNFGGTDADGGGFVRQTSDGGFIVTGYSYDASGSNPDLLLMKTDGSGNVSWAKTYGGISYEAGYCVSQNSDGGYIVAGYTASYAPGGYNIFLLRTDSAGTLTWAKSAGGGVTDIGNWVEQTADGGFIVAGYTLSYGAGGSDVFLAKTDSNGTAQWVKTYGTTLADGGFCVQAVSGGHVVSGYSMVSTGNEDALLISTDSSGNILWSKTYGGISTERAYTVQPSADGGYILGGFTGSFGSSPYDLYLIKTNNTGYSGCNENSSALSTFPAPFTATTPSPAVASGISSGNPSVVTGSGCLISTPCIATGTIDVQAKEFLLYPNPTSSSIKLIAEAGNYFLSIKNTLGETVLIKSVTEKEFSVDVKDFPSGIYFVSITDQKKNMVVKKFVKM